MPSPFGGLYFTRRKSKLNSKFTFRVVLNWMPYFCLSYDNRHVDPHQVQSFKRSATFTERFCKVFKDTDNNTSKVIFGCVGSSFYISYSIFLSFCQSYRFKVPGNHLTITQFTYPQHFLNVNWKSNEFWKTFLEIIALKVWNRNTFAANFFDHFEHLKVLEHLTEC